ncbi:hypothetical protein LEP1GSC072_1251 [Leptospira noguchii str. Bonito]|nr:hypothetical protein LEP1GSC072_1251 [Leptospira noguchii str. Bonito]
MNFDLCFNRFDLLKFRKSNVWSVMPKIRYAPFDAFKHNFILNVFDKSFLLLPQRTFIKMNFKFEDDRTTAICCRNFL